LIFLGKEVRTAARRHGGHGEGKDEDPAAQVLDFAMYIKNKNSSAQPAYTQAELEAGYKAMAADEEYEREALEL